jgi:hypothetical protein
MPAACASLAVLAVSTAALSTRAATPDPRVVTVELDRAALKVDALDHVEAEVRTAITAPPRADISIDENQTAILVRIRDSEAGAGLIAAIRKRVSDHTDFTLTEAPALIYHIALAPRSGSDPARRSRDLTEIAAAMSQVRPPLPGVRVEDEVGAALVHIDDLAAANIVAEVLGRRRITPLETSKLDDRTWRVTLDPRADAALQSEPSGVLRMFGMTLSPGRALLMRLQIGDLLRRDLRDPPDLDVETGKDGVEAWLVDPDRHTAYGERQRQAADGRSDLVLSHGAGRVLQIQLAKPVDSAAASRDPLGLLAPPSEQVNKLYRELSELVDPAVDISRDRNALVVSTTDPSRRSEVREALMALSDLKVEEGRDRALHVTSHTAPVAAPTPDSALLARTVEARARALGAASATATPVAPDRIEARFASAAEADAFRRSIRSASTALAFRFVDDAESASSATPPSPGDQSVPRRAPASGRLWLRPETPIRGDMVADAHAANGFAGEPVVSFRLTAEGADTFAAATSGNIGRRFAIVLDGKIIAAPRINAPIPAGEGIIECGCTVDEAQAIAAAIKAYPADAPLKLVEPSGQ